MKFLKRNSDTVIFVIAVLILAMFLYTGFDKIRHMAAFKAELYASPLDLIAQNSKLIAYVIPWMEIVACLLLLFPKTQYLGFMVSLMLFLSFTIYIAALFNIDKKMPCSCGGIISYLSWKQHLVVNIIYVFVTAVATVMTYRSRKIMIHSRR